MLKYLSYCSNEFGFYIMGFHILFLCVALWFNYLRYKMLWLKMTTCSSLLQILVCNNNCFYVYYHVFLQDCRVYPFIVISLFPSLYKKVIHESFKPQLIVDHFMCIVFHMVSLFSFSLSFIVYTFFNR